MDKTIKLILQRQEEYLEKESERYFAQRKRLQSWPWWKKKLLGQVYKNLWDDMEDMHSHIQYKITDLAKTLMEMYHNFSNTR